MLRHEVEAIEKTSSESCASTFLHVGGQQAVLLTAKLHKVKLTMLITLSYQVAKALLQIFVGAVQGIVQHLLLTGLHLVKGCIGHPRFFNIHVEVIVIHVVLLEERLVVKVLNVELRVNLCLIVELIHGVDVGGVPATSLQDCVERPSYSNCSAVASGLRAFLPGVVPISSEYWTVGVTGGTSDAVAPVELVIGLPSFCCFIQAAFWARTISSFFSANTSAASKAMLRSFILSL